MPDATQTAVPEMRGWQSWYIRSAEFEGRRLVLTDGEAIQKALPNSPHRVSYRYWIGVGPEPCACPAICPQAKRPHACAVWQGDDLAEGTRIFYEQEEILRAQG